MALTVTLTEVVVILPVDGYSLRTQRGDNLLVSNARKPLMPAKARVVFFCSKIPSAMQSLSESIQLLCSLA